MLITAIVLEEVGNESGMKNAYKKNKTKTKRTKTWMSTA